jgi:hypothetical protein
VQDRPQAVKPITGKQYSGNSPKPYWIVERLTEEFGPCGKGWGFTILSERMERLSDTDVLHVALVRFWYVLEWRQARRVRADRADQGRLHANKGNAAGGRGRPEEVGDRCAGEVRQLPRLRGRHLLRPVGRLQVRREAENLDDTQKMSLWSILDAPTRASIKKAQKAMREAA